MCTFLIFCLIFFFQAEDGIRDAHWWLEFRRVLFQSDLDQRFLHDAAGLAEIHASRVALLQRRHDTAHVLHAGGAELADDALDGRAHVGLVHLLRQEALDDLDLLAFALREVGAAAAGVHFDGFLALTHHRSEEHTSELQSLLRTSY